jgi:TPR repeat protein
MLEKGDGVEKNTAEAFRYLRLAADKEYRLDERAKVGDISSTFQQRGGRHNRLDNGISWINAVAQKERPAIPEGVNTVGEKWNSPSHRR